MLMFCPSGSGITFVKDVPIIVAEGGAIIFALKSGQSTSQFAYPMWLARIVNKRVAAIIAEQDSKTA